MSIFALYFITSLINSEQMIGRSNAMPHSNEAFSLFNQTTTAVPKYNHSETLATAYTPTTTSTMSTVMQTTNAYHTTQTMLSPKINISSDQGAKMVSPPAATISDSRKEIIGRYFVTTTAIPLSEKSEAGCYHFDGLSFAGGALSAIAFIVLGVVSWKMYMARIERRYWTL